MIEFLYDFMIPVIMGICLCVGFVIKKWIKDVDNKYIPTICCLLGLVVAAWIHWGNITPEVVLMGLASGLGSTGLHQAFKQILDNKIAGKDETNV